MILRWLRGLALLRHPELIRDLGERRFQLQAIGRLRQRFPGAKLSDDIRLVGFAPERLELGSAVSVCAGTLLVFGDEQNGYGRIQIGDSTWVGQYNNLRAGGGDIRIGRGCLISQFCTLVAANHACSRLSPIRLQGPDLSRCGVVLEDDVWLGAGVSILPGVTIGQGVVIGANAVVTRTVPPYEIWGGVPAQKLGERKKTSDG